MMPLTPWVKRLLFANVVMFLITMASPPIYRLLLLYPPWILYRPWTAVTYMFLHAGIGHIFFNMLGLYFFGPRLESRLGAKHFLWLYFLAGLGGALGSIFLAPRYPVVGASAAVYGVLVGFAMYWPREKIYLWMILPVEAWLLALILVGATLYMGVTGSQSGTAHFAHLGGIVVGFAYLKILEWRRGAPLRQFQKAMKPQSSGLSDRATQARWRGISTEGMHEINRDEIHRLWSKLDQDGAGSLSQAEREFLDRMSSR